MRKIILLLTLLAVPSMVRAQAEVAFLPETLDSRNVALGRTSIASTAGSNAIFANPALLGTLNDAQFQVGGRLLYGIGIVAIDIPHHMPAIGLKTQRRIVSKPSFYLTIDRDTIIVIEDD